MPPMYPPVLPWWQPKGCLHVGHSSQSSQFMSWKEGSSCCFTQPMMIETCRIAIAMTSRAVSKWEWSWPHAINRCISDDTVEQVQCQSEHCTVYTLFSNTDCLQANSSRWQISDRTDARLNAANDRLACQVSIAMLAYRAHMQLVAWLADPFGRDR